MTAHTSRIRRLISALRPVQAPNLKPWSPEFYAHRPNVVVRGLGLIALVAVMGFGLMGSSEPQLPAETAMSELVVDETLQASVVDDVLDFIEEILGMDDEDPPADG